MGQEVKTPLRAQSKYGLMGSSAKTGKFCFRGSPEHSLDKNAIWDRTPPHLHINCSLHVWGRVQGSQIFKRNSIISIRSKVMAFLVILLSPWSPRCPHVIHIIPTSSPLSPHHPHSPQKVPMWSPWLWSPWSPPLSLWSPPHVAPVIPVIPISSPSSPHHPHSPQKVPMWSPWLWSPWSPPLSSVVSTPCCPRGPRHPCHPHVIPTSSLTPQIPTPPTHPLGVGGPKSVKMQ